MRRRAASCRARQGALGRMRPCPGSVPCLCVRMRAPHGHLCGLQKLSTSPALGLRLSNLVHSSRRCTAVHGKQPRSLPQLSRARRRGPAGAAGAAAAGEEAALRARVTAFAMRAELAQVLLSSLTPVCLGDLATDERVRLAREVRRPTEVTRRAVRALLARPSRPRRARRAAPPHPARVLHQRRARGRAGAAAGPWDGPLIGGLVPASPGGMLTCAAQ